MIQRHVSTYPWIFHRFVLSSIRLNATYRKPQPMLRREQWSAVWCLVFIRSYILKKFRRNCSIWSYIFHVQHSGTGNQEPRYQINKINTGKRRSSQVFIIWSSSNVIIIRYPIDLNLLKFLLRYPNIKSLSVTGLICLETPTLHLVNSELLMMLSFRRCLSTTMRRF